MFDSRVLYLVQALLIGTVVYVLVRRQHRILRLQVISWTFAVAVIAWRYGTEAQLGFYSNDQIQYAAVVRTLMSWNWAGESPNVFWWTEYAKLPYPVAALPLALIGVHVALALKAVSLVCLLALSHDILQRFGATRLWQQSRFLYLTGCGMIGTFFSVLALRETMMMYLVFRYVSNRTLTGKLLALLLIFLLRSHLAAALLVAEMTLVVWDRINRRNSVGFAQTPIVTVVGVTLGYMMFSWRFNGMQNYEFFRRIQTPFNGEFGIAETLQVASNFAGLQFLTAHEAFVRLSVTDLLVLRFIFSDTVVIPLGFTFVCIVAGLRLHRSHRFALLAFAIYVSIVTNTDFNSFRQNIPLMPLMGIVILDFLKDRELQRSASAAKLSDTSVESAASIRGVIPSRVS